MNILNRKLLNTNLLIYLITATLSTKKSLHHIRILRIVWKMDENFSPCLKQFEVPKILLMWKWIQKKIISYTSLINKPWTNWIIKIETKNENLVLQMELYTDQIKLLNKIFLSKAHLAHTDLLLVDHLE